MEDFLRLLMASRTCISVTLFGSRSNFFFSSVDGVIREFWGWFDEWAEFSFCTFEFILFRAVMSNLFESFTWMLGNSIRRFFLGCEN